MKEIDESGMRVVLFYVFLGFFVIIVILTILMVFWGFGHATEEERTMLFRLFILEIAAAIITLFYTIFKIRKDGDLEEDKECISFDNIVKYVGKLDEYLKSQCIKFDYIISFSGGGLLVSDLLHIIHRPTIPIIAVEVKRYDALPGGHQTIHIEDADYLKIKLKNKKVLILDDVVATGNTISEVASYLIESIGVQKDDIYTAVLGKVKKITTTFKPHHYVFDYIEKCKLPWGEVPRSLPKALTYNLTENTYE